MKTNEVGETICIFEAFDMEKFFDKMGLIDTLHTMYTPGKMSTSDYRMWFHLNNKTKISILTPLGETDGATIMNGIGQGSFTSIFSKHRLWSRQNNKGNLLCQYRRSRTK